MNTISTINKMYFEYILGEVGRQLKNNDVWKKGLDWNHVDNSLVILSDHPMKQKLGNLTKNRQRGSSFVHEAKHLSRTVCDRLGAPTTTLEKREECEDRSLIANNTPVPNLKSGTSGLVHQDAHYTKQQAADAIHDVPTKTQTVEVIW